MRLFFTVISGVMLFSCCAWAQEDNVTTATSALQSVLSNLKQSVDKLSVDNDQLAARDNAVKQQVLQLQMQLGRLESQGDSLNKATDKLKEENPGRAQRISDLEEENLDLDHRTQKSQDAVKLIQQTLDSRYQEEQKLLLQLKGLQNALPADARPLESPAEIHRQKEKLKLMKMIYDSQQRQEALHESIMDVQKNTPLLPAASALAHQQLLKEQIKDLEDQIAAYPSGKSELKGGSSEAQGDNAFWNDTQLRQLELELKSLEENYSQLKDLMEQMTKKAQVTRMTTGQNLEEGKLKNSFDDLNHQRIGLSVSLDDLRTQMVDLDKRKTKLEGMIQN